MLLCIDRPDRCSWSPVFQDWRFRYSRDCVGKIHASTPVLRNECTQSPLCEKDRWEQETSEYRFFHIEYSRYSVPLLRPLWSKHRNSYSPNSSVWVQSQTWFAPYLNGFYPVLSSWIEKITYKKGVIMTWCFVVFMTFNILMSGLALSRYSQRQNGLKAQNSVERYIDQQFPDQRMKMIYPNAKFPVKR